jgi:hypothetical protein
VKISPNLAIVRFLLRRATVSVEASRRCSVAEAESILQPPCVPRRPARNWIFAAVLPENFPAIAQRPPIHTTSRAVCALIRPVLHPACDSGWVCCETLFIRLVVLANRISSAIGTPLEWPEAKKVASHVRSWGIEV